MSPRGAAFRVAVAVAGLAVPSVVVAQGYRLRVDTRFQTVAFRGVTLDSVAVQDLVGDSGSVRTTPDGFAVRCRAGLAVCTYYRPGPTRQGRPLVTTADLAVWGIVRGLSTHVTTRLGADLGDDVGWPGTDPSVQLLEGYVQYAAAGVTARGGRSHRVSRFGFVGFDGASVQVRNTSLGLQASAYGGVGLARAAALPVTSPALNPLDDFQPRQRQAMAGGDVAWSGSHGQVRVVYLREFRQGSGDIVSERGGIEAVGRLPAGFAVAAGADYDLSAGWWGSAEATVSFDAPGDLGYATAGVRRYRPHFPLWTIWGAFSPVPYRAAFGSLRVRPARGLELSGHGEVYEFDEADAGTPFVTVERDGWRWSVRGRYGGSRRWAVYGDAHVERGTGAASSGFGGGMEVRPVSGVLLSAGAGLLERPLEFRFDDARVSYVGGRVEASPHPSLRFTAELARYDETRRRPDAAQFDWNQNRLSVWGTFVMGSEVSRQALPSAVLRVPPRSVGR